MNEGKLNDVEKILRTILKEECVYTVFQPIVKFQEAEIIGYEALSRFDCAIPDISVEEIFQAADNAGLSWELEKLCRKRALKTAGKRHLTKKLFLNVDPNIMNDAEFKEGFTKHKLEKYNLNPSMLVFEVTERTAFSDYKTFNQSISHYRNQNFSIAIDDFGSGYSSISLVCETSPEFIKIDKSIIHNIHHDKSKKNMVKNLVTYAKESNVHCIAEGIECESELRCLINLGIEYGQGFYLGRGIPVFGNILNDAASVLQSIQEQRNVGFVSIDQNVRSKNQGRKISTLSRKGATVLSNSKALNVFNLVHDNPEIAGVVIVDTQNRVEGYIPTRELTEIFGGKYGFSLNQNKLIQEIMEIDFLCVSEDMNVEDVSHLAMKRNEEALYDPIVVSKGDGIYSGIVIIKDLLDSLIEIEVKDRTIQIEKAKDELQSAMNKLKESSFRAERDLAMASQVQKSIYPHTPPKTAEWDCAYLFRPMASVSGDVFDFFTEGDDLKGASLFDVSGHGISSGLVGILAKSLGSRLFWDKLNRPLESVFYEMNKELIAEKGDAENYLTGVLFRTDGKKLEYVNAGHPDVLVCHNGSVKPLRDTNSSDDFKGRFLGIADLPTDFKTLQVNLACNDVILAFSDCLIESVGLNGEQFGSERLSEALANATHGLYNNPYDSNVITSAQILDSIMTTFSAFTSSKPLNDDLTILVLRRK